ncbi:MAG: MATE family efflux transporter [Bacteroidetes bacterium]|nr:MATE family efflux transporter [Fibrella sp.]
MHTRFQTYRRELADTLRLSIPIIIAQLSVVLMGVTDNLFVGRLLGGTALGAAGLANSLSFLVSSVGVGSLTVVAALVSQARGQGDAVAVNRLYRAGLLVALLLSIVSGLASVWLAFNFELIGQTASVSALAEPFMLILSASIVPLLLFIAIRQLCDGLAEPRVAMAITLLALGLNALFNYVLILGVGPFPALGLNGSATATLLSRVFMAVSIWVYVYRASVFRPYFTVMESARGIGAPLAESARTILRLGLPGGLTFFFEVATFSIAAIMVGWLGDDWLAAHQIAINVASTTYMMATGISAAGAIRIGAALGSGNRELIFRAGVAAFMLSIALMGAAGLVLLTVPGWLVGLYIDPLREPAVYALAPTLVVIAGIFQLSDGIQVVAVGALRGLSDVNVPTLITLFAYWVVSLPVSYALCFWLNMDAVGIWIGLLFGLTVAAVLLTIRFFRLSRRGELPVVSKRGEPVISH